MERSIIDGAGAAVRDMIPLAGGVGPLQPGSVAMREARTKPATLREVGCRVWLETLNQLAEYGTLVLFGAGAVAAEAGRRSVELSVAANLAVIVAECVSALAMIAPKAIHAAGGVVEVLIFTCHDVAFAVRHGARRPNPD